jgi:hypothetical protein
MLGKQAPFESFGKGFVGLFLPMVHFDGEAISLRDRGG